jgi:hypothetical protein
MRWNAINGSTRVTALYRVENNHKIGAGGEVQGFVPSRPQNAGGYRRCGRV